MFSQASVILFTGGGACVEGSVLGGGHGRGACMAGGCAWWEHAWQGGLCGRGHMRQGACMAGGMRGRGGMHGRGCAWQGGRAWQERRPLQRTVRILLEYILIIFIWLIGTLFRYLLLRAPLLHRRRCVNVCLLNLEINKFSK